MEVRGQGKGCGRIGTCRGAGVNDIHKYSYNMFNILNILFATKTRRGGGLNNMRRRPLGWIESAGGRRPDKERRPPRPDRERRRPDRAQAAGGRIESACGRIESVGGRRRDGERRRPPAG